MMDNRFKGTGKAEIDKILIVITFLSWCLSSENTIFGKVIIQIENQQPPVSSKFNTCRPYLYYVLKIKGCYFLY